MHPIALRSVLTLGLEASSSPMGTVRNSPETSLGGNPKVFTTILGRFPLGWWAPTAPFDFGWTKTSPNHLVASNLCLALLKWL